MWKTAKWEKRTLYNRSTHADDIILKNARVCYIESQMFRCKQDGRAQRCGENCTVAPTATEYMRVLGRF